VNSPTSYPDIFTDILVVLPYVLFPAILLHLPSYMLSSLVRSRLSLIIFIGLDDDAQHADLSR